MSSLVVPIQRDANVPLSVKKYLKQFMHKLQKEQHVPHPSAPIIYGRKINIPLQHQLQRASITRIKEFIPHVCGKFLFLDRAVESTLLCPISVIYSQSATPTKDTMQKTQQIMDYIATQEEAVLTFVASDMKFAAHSDASYLSKPKAHSRTGGHFFLSSNSIIPQNNWSVLNTYRLP